METNISNLKAHLSETLDLVRKGEVVTVLDRTVPIAIITKFEENRDQIRIRPAINNNFQKKFKRIINHSIELYYNRDER
ncbi:hypothetical protein P3G55_03745 [Leptospira sp. 96542]|nr:hypothetical protein [Leptospira sp. 96542]